MIVLLAIPCCSGEPPARRRRRTSAREQERNKPKPTRRTRCIASVLRTPPRVLNSTAANCGPPFGTKRPQVQILSPRPVPQVSDLRECRASLACVPLQPPSRRPEGTNKEHEGTLAGPSWLVAL